MILLFHLTGQFRTGAYGIINCIQGMTLLAGAEKVTGDTVVDGHQSYNFANPFLIAVQTPSAAGGKLPCPFKSSVVLFGANHIIP